MEHRQHIAIDVGAQRILRGVARNELAGSDVVAIWEQQIFLHHRRRAALMNDGNVDVPSGGAGFLLRGQLLVNFLRA